MLPALALASVGLQLGGNLLQGQESYKQAKQDAAALEWNADNAEREGRLMFKSIKKQGESVLGAAQVGLATSGFRYDSAQSVEIKDEIVKNVASDAMNAVLSGQLAAGSMRRQAREIRSAARESRNLGIVTTFAGAGLAAFGASK